MLASCKLQLCRTQHHLAHNAIGIGTRDTVLDRRIAQGLDCHGDKCRSATTHRAAHEQQARIELDHRTELAKQIKHHCALLITKRGSLLAGDDALAHRNRCVGHRRDMRDARQDLLPLGTVPGPGNRQNDLFGKSILERGEYLLDHIRFDRSDHDIGCGDNLGGIVASGHPTRLTALNQCVVATRTGAHVARSYTGSDPAIGHGARHIAKTDKSNLHIS